jgi:hypothetical protein
MVVHVCYSPRGNRNRIGSTRALGDIILVLLKNVEKVVQPRGFRPREIPLQEVRALSKPPRRCIGAGLSLVCSSCVCFVCEVKEGPSECSSCPTATTSSDAYRFGLEPLARWSEGTSALTRWSSMTAARFCLRALLLCASASSRVRCARVLQLRPRSPTQLR